MAKFKVAQEGYMFVHTEKAEMRNKNRVKGTPAYPDRHLVYESWVKLGYVVEVNEEFPWK